MRKSSSALGKNLEIIDTIKEASVLGMKAESFHQTITNQGKIQGKRDPGQRSQPLFEELKIVVRSINQSIKYKTIND